MNDPVNKPSHYYVTCPGVANDDGTVTVECRHVMHGLGLNRNFMTGAAFKYLWRCLKKANTVEDIVGRLQATPTEMIAGSHARVARAACREPAPDNAECFHAWLARPGQPEIIRVEQRGHWGIYPYADRSPEDFRRLRWAYFRLIEKVDREIGRVLEGLSDCGLQDDTVVVLSSDHGDAHGAHRWNQKSALFEEIIRVPLIIRAPDATAGLRDREHLISTGPDLYATILDYAGVEVPVGRRGLSLRSLVAAEPSVWRDALCVETLFDGGRGYDTQGRALIAGWDKYVLYDRGRYREQLFNLETDPGEMVNLAVQDRHRGTLERCRALLREQLAQTGDRFTGL